MGAQNILMIHYFICSIGILGIVKNVSSGLGQFIVYHLNVFVAYSDWATISTEPTKPAELLQYGLSVSVMAIYYVMFIIIVRSRFIVYNKIIYNALVNHVALIVYVIFLIILNISLLVIHGMLAKIILCAWLLIFFLPMYPLMKYLVELMEKKEWVWSVAIFISIIAALFFSFYPYVSGGIAVSNDYMDIPEQTILSTGIVDNTGYINAHRIGGLNKYDPRVGRGKNATPRDKEVLKLSKNEAISSFVANNQLRFDIDEASGHLIVKSRMTHDEARDLANMARNEMEREGVYSFFYNQQSALQEKKNYSSEEVEFLRKNKRELLDQALAGHYFHHQHTMLGTINEYVLGRPQKETVFLYGWFGTVAIAEIMKALDGVTFESYQKVFYLFYPLYYILLLVASVILFKDFKYVLLVGVISISTLLFLGFETIRFAPGFNPVRHFFDIFALVSFYWYLFAPRKNKLYLALALMCSTVAIFFSKEFGLVLLLAMLATVIVRHWVDHRQSFLELLFVIVAIVAAITSLLLIETGKNQTLLYVLLGVAAPAMNLVVMCSLLVLFSGIYVLIVIGVKSGDKWSYLSLFWFIYTQGVLLYYIWNPAPNHLVSLGSVWGMLLVLLLRLWCSNYAYAAKCEKMILLASNSLLALFLFLPSISFYCFDQYDYNKVFSHHKLYRWNFPRAQFVSTMDPSVFENAVQLINKYSAGQSIYMLSKYDNILPFLSSKYNKMPFAEMALSLVTKKEMDKTVALIHHDFPEYLFVDTDMMRNHGGDVYDKDDPVGEFVAPIYEASRGRAMVLDNFSKVFKQIQHLYEPIETGQLITVYRRRNVTPHDES